jgi:hypothetical protein
MRTVILGVLLVFKIVSCQTVMAGERYLLAADTQVVEVERSGKVTAILKHPGHGGIYDATRLADGGIAYAHRGGLAVFDSAQRLVLSHPASAGPKGAEANSCVVLQKGTRFALLDSGDCKVRIIDRSGSVLSEIPLPDLQEEPLHFRYRMLREVPGENAFWVCQYARKTVLKIDAATGRVMQSIEIGGLLSASTAVQKAFSVLPAKDGTLFVSTSTGCQLLHMTPQGGKLGCWTSTELGLSCRYLLGMQQLSSGNLLLACGDYHLQNAAEGGDVLAEIDGAGKVVWRLTREQVLDQIEGPVDKRTGLEELHVTGVHVYDNEGLGSEVTVPVGLSGPAPGETAGPALENSVSARGAKPAHQKQSFLAPPPDIGAFLERHCVQCHDDSALKGDFDITALEYRLEDPANLLRWGRVFEALERGQMPPPEKSKVEMGERAVLLASLGAELVAADAQDVAHNGRGPLRRLTRVEFENNVRLLLRMPHLDIRDKLPEDRDLHGFTKVTALLDMSRVQMEGYLDAAETALRAAMAGSVAAPAPVTKRFTGLQLFPALNTFGEREAMFFARNNRMVPITGDTLKAMTPEQIADPSLELALFRSATWPYYGYPQGFVARREGVYRVRFKGRAVRQVRDFRLVPALEPLALTFRARQPSGPDVSGDVRETGGWMDLQADAREFETHILLKAGETFEYSPLGLPVPFIRTDGGFFYDFPPMGPEGHRGIAIEWLEVSGPLVGDTWPPYAHGVLFEKLPLRAAKPGASFPVEVASELPKEDARRQLRRFAGQAALRPVEESELEPFLRIVETKLDAGAPFAEALLAAYQSFLCSSHCLYVTEPRANAADRQQAVAARLSHLFWNARPDAELERLAHEGRLGEREVLRAQTERLIDDARFAQFVASFGDEWLDLRKLRRDLPDERLYPEYRRDDYLVDSMERETRAFLTAMLRENLPATSLVTSGFTFVNDRLARHYDLPRVSGSELQRVELPGWSPHGGLLTQAAVLKHTSNGVTTSPVLRGVWAMEKLLGQAPPPPPKSVPAIDPDIRGAKTIREQLAKHTQSASCAGCHALFDPVGFALENFDVMGAWRDRYRGMERGEKITGIDPAGHPYTYFVAQAVDASGKLHTGEAFADVRELKRLLAANPRQLGRGFLSHLILHATGTPLRFADRPELERLLDLCAANGYRIKDLVHALVQSGIFLGEAGG